MHNKNSGTELAHSTLDALANAGLVVGPAVLAVLMPQALWLPLAFLFARGASAGWNAHQAAHRLNDLCDDFTRHKVSVADDLERLASDLEFKSALAEAALEDMADSRIDQVRRLIGQAFETQDVDRLNFYRTALRGISAGAASPVDDVEFAAIRSLANLTPSVAHNFDKLRRHLDGLKSHEALMLRTAGLIGITAEQLPGAIMGSTIDRVFVTEVGMKLLALLDEDPVQPEDKSA